MKKDYTIGLLTSFVVFLVATVLLLLIGASAGLSTLDLLSKFINGAFTVLEFTMLSILLWMSFGVICESPPIGKIIKKIGEVSSTHARAGTLISFVAVTLGWINWIFGLYFSLLLAREIARSNIKKGVKLHYPYLLSCAFSASAIGLLGLFSPIQLFLADKLKHFAPIAKAVPISITHTVFSPLALVISLAIVILLPIAFYILRPKDGNVLPIPSEEVGKPEPDKIIYHPPPPPEKQVLAEKLENSFTITLIAAVVGLIGFAYQLLIVGNPLTFRRAIFLLFMVGLLLNKRPIEFAYKMRETATLSLYIPFVLFLGAGVTAIALDIGVYNSLASGVADWSIMQASIAIFILSLALSLVIPEISTIFTIVAPVIFLAKVGAEVISPVIALVCGFQVAMLLQPYIHLSLLKFDIPDEHLREMSRILRRVAVVAFIVYLLFILIMPP